MSFDSVTKIDDVFFYNKEFYILDCMICQYCLESSKTIKIHIKQYYKYIFKKINIDNYIIKKINIHTIKDLKNVQLSAFKKHCFKYLTIFNNAFSCTQCEYACLNEKYMKVYCNKVYNYKKKSKFDNNLYLSSQKV